jgi:hypothetical protein
MISCGLTCTWVRYIIGQVHRCVLRPISMMNDIGLSLISEPPISNWRGCSPSLWPISFKNFYRLPKSDIRIFLPSMSMSFFTFNVNSRGTWNWTWTGTWTWTLTRTRIQTRTRPCTFKYLKERNLYPILDCLILGLVKSRNKLRHRI